MKKGYKKAIQLCFCGIFVYLFSFQITSAAVLLPGSIGTCGELASTGVYELSTNVGTSSETCFTVTSSGVTITGGTSTQYSIAGNVVGNKSNYDVVNTTSTGDQSIFYYDNNQADGDWANLDNWWFDSSYTETANISGVTVPSTEDQVVVDGTVSQVSSGDIDVFSARFVNSSLFEFGGDPGRLDVLEFDGNGDYVGGNYTSSTVTNTVSFWINTTTSVAGLPISKYRTYQIRFESNGRIAYIPWRDTNNLHGYFQATTAVNDGEWHHVAAAWDLTNAKIWIDGVLEVDTPGNTTGSLYGGNSWITIAGRRQSQNTLLEPFTGKIAEVVIRNDVMTDEEVLSEYQNGVDDSDVGIVYYYKLDEGSGTTANDTEGTFNAGLFGDPTWTTDGASPTLSALIASGDLNLYASSDDDVIFEDDSVFSGTQISTSADGNVDTVTFQDNSYATDVDIYADNLLINTSTSSVGIYEIKSDNTDVDISNISASSTITLTGDRIDLTLNNSVSLNSITGSNVDVVLNNSSYIDDMVLTSASNTITFNTDYYHGSSTPEGTLVFNGVSTSLDGSVTNEDYLTVYDSNDTEITGTEFNDTSVNEFTNWPYPVTFNDSSVNYGTIRSNVTFNDSSTNIGTIYGNVTVNSPVSKPLGGTVNGTITYVGYGNYYYNNAEADGDAGNANNWWSDEDFTVSASTPSSGDDVAIYGNTATGTTGILNVQSAELYSGTSDIIVNTLLGADVYNSSVVNGTIVGTTTFYGDSSELNGNVVIDDLYENVSVFDGAADYYSIPTASTVGTTGVFSTWVKLVDDDGTPFPLISQHWDGDNDQSFRIEINPASVGSQEGVTIVHDTRGCGGVLSGVYTGVEIPYGEWVHIAVTSDGSTWRIYVDGEQQSLTPWLGTNTGAWFGDSCINVDSDIGHWIISGGESFFKGNMSNIRLYSEWFGSDDILDIYNGGVYTSTDNLVFHYPLQDDFEDLSDNGYDGSNVGVSFTTDTTRLASSDQNSGTILRSYSSDTTTTRDFTENSGRWIIEANSSDIDISGATYSTSTNIFRAKLGSTFTENPSIGGGGNVVPKVQITTPTSGTNTRWNPVIDWSDADTCEYKFGSDDYTTVTCGNNGSDIPKPTALTETTLYVKGTYDNTSYSEQLTTFTYDNVTPIAIDCSFTLDEADREYYYLEADVVGNCYATASTTIRGEGYTITGSVIADASSTNDGSNLSLQNITVTGTTSSNGTDGGDAGDITIDVSITGPISANGGDSTSDGGNGGDITITNSLASPLTSTITANGGSSTSCGNGGDAGTVTLTGSSYGTITNNAGEGSNDSCPGGGNTSGSRTAPSVTGQYTGPFLSQNNNQTTSPTSGSSVERLLELGLISPLDFSPITEFAPIFGDQFNLGESEFGDIVGELNPLSELFFKAVPENILPSIEGFALEDIPENIAENILNRNGALALLSAAGINKAQDLASLTHTPRRVDAIYDILPVGLFRIHSNGNKIDTYITYEPALENLGQLVRVESKQILQIGILPQEEGGGYIEFRNIEKELIPTYDGYLATSIVAPEVPGRYVIDSNQSRLPLIVDVINPNPNRSTKPWGPFNWLWKLTH